MFQVIDRPDRRAIITPVARLDFLLLGDRWSHRLTRTSAGEEGPPIASSVEALESAEPWSDPPSPTYQEVTLLVTPDDALVACLGQFGPNHYATAFAIRHLPSTPGTPPGAADDRVSTTVIEVDVAVRRGDSVRPLAATYTVHSPPSTLSWASPAGVCWEWGDPSLLAVLERRPDTPDHPAPTTIQVDEAGRAACRVQALVESSGKTTRLKYTWLISDPTASPTRPA